MIETILLKLNNHKLLSDEECFELASHISIKTNSNEEHVQQQGRELIISVLDNWKNLSNVYKPVFSDLVASAGFYPYLNRLESNNQSLDEKIRFEYHKSDSLNKYFHLEQKKISEIIKSKTNIIVSAPTSFGKSMLIEEIVASNLYRNIVIIQPTLALLDETRKKLKQYSNNYKIIVKTSQDFSEEKGNIFLLTAERVLEYFNMPEIELLVLDEFYKLSNTRGDNRNNILNTAFVRIMKNPNCKFYMLGPNIDTIPKGFTEKYNAVFYKTNYSMVKTNDINKYDQVRIRRGNKVSDEDLFNVLDGLNEQTLIYCSSPKTARHLAFSYCEHLISKDIQFDDVDIPLIDWIDKNISYRWSLAKCLKYRIAVHDGSMPKHITTSTIDYFNKHKITYLFCTNTIIEGVNTSAKNVVYYDNTIGKKIIDYFDYSNIKGRAGRLMEHYTGNIINLREPPFKEETHVDFPFFEQNPIDSEVLINLDEADVKNINDNVERYNSFKEYDFELQDILKRNAVSIEGQLNILNTLKKDLMIPSNREMIIWSRIDAKLYKRLTYIFDLCWENLSTEDERKSFGSKKWVVNKIVGSCYRSSINDMIEKDLEYRSKKLAEDKGVEYISIDEMFKLYPSEMQERADNQIEMMFSLQKNWLQYRAPKWINVVDSLQKYATKGLNLLSGDYSYVAEMIENDFIQSSFRILLEYGVPQTAVSKIQLLLDAKNINDLSEDDLLNIINENKELLQKCLSRYEYEIIEKVL